MAGKSIGKLSIGVDLDAGKAQQGLATLSAEVNALGSAITNMGKNFASSFAAGFGVGSLLQIVSDLGSKLADITKWAAEFKGRMDTVSISLKDAFDIDISKTGLAKLAMQTGQTLEQLGGLYGKMADVGLGFDLGKSLMSGAAGFDSKFGGVGKAAEFTLDMLAKLRKEFNASDKDIQVFENRGVKVYERLGQMLGVSAEKARELAKAGKVSAADAASALTAVMVQKGRDYEQARRGESDGMEGFGMEQLSAAQMEAQAKNDMAQITSNIRAGRFANFAGEAAKKLESEADKLAAEISGLVAELAKQPNVNDPKAIAERKTLEGYLGVLKDKFADLVNSEWMGQADQISADFEKQEKDRLEKQARIEALLGEGLGLYEQFVRKNAETMKRFDDMAEKLDGDQRLAVLRAKDRALKQANDQADEQFMDANQKLANRMAELQESMKKAQAAGDMAGVNRFQAALGIEAKKIAALGTRQQGSSLATLNNYGSQEWAQARVRAWDTDNRSDADKYKEGLDKLNMINEQTGKDVKRMADAVEKLGIPQPVSLGKR